ncbi:MAG: RNA-binding S4 domain-containing protein [Oscillospiraceae bacterium]|nr:RNA-binding S4 domain-containing protein [Oscillospiraceae bacterium]
MEKKVTIETEYIKLEALLKLTGAVGTGGEAKFRIQEGQVSVNGEVCLQRGRKLRSGDRVRLGRDEFLVEAPCA